MQDYPADLPFEPLDAPVETDVGYQNTAESGDMTEQSNFQDSSDADLVRETLREIMRDKDAPASAKAQAARTMAEMTMQLGRNQREPVDPGQPVKEMTRAAIEAELKAMKAP